MKKIGFLLLIWCFSALAHAQWVTDNQFGFKISVPSSWSQENKMDGTDKVYDFVHPSQNIFLEVRAFKADASINADMISQVFESQYLSTASRLAFQDYTLNNTPGKFGGYKMTVNGLEVGIGAFYAVKNGMGYVIWSMIETRLYNQYSGESDAVMNTFTSFSPASSGGARAVVIPAAFKITNMKLGSKLTADFDILPQDESSSFSSDAQKIFVIWDWEGNAPGKTMSIRWFRNGSEMSAYKKNYTLPNNKQGYGWANIDMPSGGFQDGNYSVQIDFEGTKQKSMNFNIKKKASDNANSGFVIKPPSSGSSDGKNIKPTPNNNSSSNSTTTSPTNSSFKLLWEFKIGEELNAGSKTELKSTSNKFYTNTPQVISTFKWSGDGSGHQLSVAWIYRPEPTNRVEIVTSTYDFPSGNGGGSNFSLSKPTAGWPIGEYWVEYSLDGKFFEEIRFDVIEGSSSGSSSSTNWGKASGGTSASSSASTSTASVKKIVLTSGGNQFCYHFKSGKINGDHNSADIFIEPWCTEEAGVCGNWVLTNYSDFSAVTSPPASGYISEKGFVDCQNMPANKVAVVKLSDGTYAKMMIQKTEFTQSQSQNPPCKHVTTIMVQYPAF